MSTIALHWPLLDVHDPRAVLSRHPYLAALPSEIHDAVRRRVLTRTYDKGALIYAEGEPPRGLYLVASGSVRIFKSSEEGKEQDLHHITAGQSFNDAAAFDGQPTVANAEAMERTVVLLIPRRALEALMLQYPEIGLSVTRVLAARVRELSALAGALSLRDVVSRIAGVLLRLPARDGVVVLPTRHELAAVVGTVREVVTRGLRHLQRRGAIRIGPGGRVRLVDRGTLERLAGAPPPARSSGLGGP